MKKLLLFKILLFIVISSFAQVHVRGYYRANGTYVQPHMRSSPDGNPYNNYSYPGNTNPYTGKVATGNPDTYLKNYYNNSSSTTTTTTSTINPLSSTYPTSTSTYPVTTSPTSTYSNNTNSKNSRNLLDPLIPTPEERATTRRANQHTTDILLAEKKYLKDKTGHYTGQYLKLSDEDDVVKKYTLYDGNDFPKGTLLVYANGDKILYDMFGKVVGQSKSKR